MNCELQYFYESLKKNIPPGKSGLSIENGKVLTRPASEYSKILLTGFRNYRHSSGVVRTGLDELLQQHTELCQERPADQLLKRRHNVLVYKYIFDTIASDKVIAKKLSVSRETLYCDINRVIWEIAVLCLGVPFLMDGASSQQRTDATLQWYPLLIRSGSVVNAVVLFPVNLQPEVERCRRLTAAYLERFQECLVIYMDYCVNMGNGIEERRKRVLQEVYLSSQNTVRQFAKDYGCCFATIYTDMKIISEQLGALMDLVKE